MEDQKVSVLQVAIAFMSMSDWPEDPPDLVVVHGLSEEMYASSDIFWHVKRLVGDGWWFNLAVVGGSEEMAKKIGWIGHEALIQRLVDVGIYKDEIMVTDEIVHSKSEAVAILKMARGLGFKSVGSISVAYHGGRMLPYMVAAMKEAGYWIDYRMLPPPTTDWFAEILGSQGLKTTTCFQSAIDDTLKIEEHINMGFAAPFEEVIHYLRNRQEIVRTQVWDFKKGRD